MFCISGTFRNQYMFNSMAYGTRRVPIAIGIGARFIRLEFIKN